MDTDPDPPEPEFDDTEIGLLDEPNRMYCNGPDLGLTSLVEKTKHITISHLWPFFSNVCCQWATFMM